MEDALTAQRQPPPVVGVFSSDRLDDGPMATAGNASAVGLGDSGYTSYQTTTPNRTMAASAFHSLAGALDTIEEDQEDLADVSMGSAVYTTTDILTPTTAASIEQISNFHLTTPEAPVAAPRTTLHHHREISFSDKTHNIPPRTPERPHRVGLSENLAKTPLREQNSASNAGQTPRKPRGQSAKRKHHGFREKLYSDGDLIGLQDYVKCDTLDDVPCKKLEGGDISPIPHSKRPKQGRIEDLMRSSTPKTTSYHQQQGMFHIEGRENIDFRAMKPGPRKGTLRKFQSFSPSKMQSAGVTGRREMVPLDRAHHRKPGLVRQNAFAHEYTLQTPKKKTDNTPTTAASPVPEPSFRTGQIINLKGLLKAPIILQDPEEDNTAPDWQADSLDECSLTPTKDANRSQSSGELPEFPSDDCIVRREVYTPMHASIASLIADESLHIPCVTPVKTSPTSLSNSARKLKRLDTCRLSSRKKWDDRSSCKSTPPKVKRRGVTRHSCIGIDRLNILKRLNEQNRDVLAIILKLLEDSDLVRVVQVSKGWRAIIENDKTASLRLRAYRKEKLQVKENISRTDSFHHTSNNSTLNGNGKADDKSITAISSSSSTFSSFRSLSCDSNGCQLSGIVNRHPFADCNSQDYGSVSLVSANSSASSSGLTSVYDLRRRSSSVQHSPPVSPSKRKFRDNQKIASHLRKSERLRTCPRCERPSRIVAVGRGGGSGKKLRNSLSLSGASGLEQSFSLPELDTSGSQQNTQQHASNGNLTTTTTPKTGRICRNLFATSSSATNGTRTGLRRRSTCDIYVKATSSLLDRKIMVGLGSVERSHDTSGDGGGSGGGPKRTPPSSKCDYAVCSGQNCGFKFCIKCLCEYHPDSECLDLAPNSPSKEEEKKGHNVACSKQSRRSLLRLRK